MTYLAIITRLLYTHDMYYIIKRQYEAPMQRFFGFIVSKYIAAKNTKHVICEFSKDDKVQRKWIKKDDIVLLTQDKNHFVKVLNRFRDVESVQQKLVEEAKAQLDVSIATFTIIMDKEIDLYTDSINSDDTKYLLYDI